MVHGREKLIPGFFRRLSPALATAAFLACAHCSPDMPLPVTHEPTDVDCSKVTATYQNFGATFFESYCLRCHSSALRDDLARFDAPLGIDFDTLEQAREFKNRIRLRAGELGDMPPHLLGGPAPSEAERIQLMEWLDCGMQ